MGKSGFRGVALVGLVSVVAILLSACDTPDTQISPAQKHESRPHTAKPGASITLKNSQPFFLENPGVSDLELVLSAPPMGGVMHVDVTVSNGLELVSSSAHFEFILSQETEYKLPIQINAPAMGRYYINLQTGIVQNEQRDNRVITAIVQVGSPAVKAKKGTGDAPVKTDGVISLPAEETILPAN